MIGRLIGLVVIAAAIVVGLSLYLAPNDLAACQQPGSSNCKKADAIVVISGGDTQARTNKAIDLYKNNWAPLLIVSGAAADKSGLSNAAAMKKQALSQDVPESVIITEEASETTKQNAVEVAAIVKKRGMKRIILVTSGYHMQRAKLEFSAQLKDIDVVVHPVANDKHWSAFWWLTPWGWWLALGELLRIGLFAIGGSR